MASLLVVLAFLGCSDGGSDADSGPFGKADAAPILAPFAGLWILDPEASLKSAGIEAPAGAEDIVQHWHEMHPEFLKLTISGNVAVGGGTPAFEYRLFGLHEHDGKVCGKAWHHEDRFDPGDMSKCYVRLSIVDDKLHFEERSQDGIVDLEDPDFKSIPPLVLGSAETCDAENPAGKNWLEWTTNVYRRKK